MIEDLIQTLQEYKRYVTPQVIKFGKDISQLLKVCKVSTDTLDLALNFDPDRIISILTWLQRHPLILRMLERQL